MSPDERGTGLRVLIMGASLCVLVWGLQAAEKIVVPVLFSAFLAVLAYPPVKWLQSKRVPDWLAVTIVFFGVIGGFMGVSMLIGNSLASFSENLPEYEARLTAMTAGWFVWLEAQGVEISTDVLLEQIDAAKAADVLGGVVASVGSMLTTTAFVMLTTVFMMLEAAGLPRKLEAALGNQGVDVGRLNGIVEDLGVYLSLKTQISLVTGLLAWVLCLAVGVDYPALWGVLTFLLHYIPNLGAIIAAIPPILLAFVQYGWDRCIVVLVGYLVIATIMGNIVEPKVMGKRLGLSSLVVWLSLVFWGFIWGTLGMFLSVPLTMVVKILLENSDDLKWAAVLLGSGAETEERLDPSKSTTGGSAS
jgi:AI-2 transport protein TqsA